MMIESGQTTLGAPFFFSVVNAFLGGSSNKSFSGNSQA